MTIYDTVGLAGTALILGTYALTVGGRIDARRAPALTGNFLGASLILVSLSHDFNLSAAIVESAWALIAGIGLIRAALKR
ncbi:MAG: cyclic nucleotide-binding protein [Proteobacteria bacterium]|nr:cyclic nucleotide-binding protein [Pseudomonadota bacterium]